MLLLLLLRIANNLATCKTILQAHQHEILTVDWSIPLSVMFERMGGRVRHSMLVRLHTPHVHVILRIQSWQMPRNKYNEFMVVTGSSRLRGVCELSRPPPPTDVCY